MPEGMPPVQDFFTRHATDYRANPSHARGEDLRILVERLRPSLTDRVLDVGTGTGHTALALAPLVREVVGIDVTEAMLEQARDLARERGVRNVRFEAGEATEIQYGLTQFDIVTTRRAAHHFAFPELFVRESHRVLRESGRLAIVDMAPPVGGERLLNEIERIRDPTHRRALSDPEWEHILAENGFRTESADVQEERYSFEEWMRPVNANGPEAVRAQVILQGASEEEARVLRLEMSEGKVQGLLKRRVILVARKA